MTAFKRRRCYECGKGTIVPRTVPGRKITFKTLRDLKVPRTLAIPTCDHCGSEWMDEDTADAIDQAMYPVYRAEIKAMAQRAIDAICAVVQQRELESALGLSSGYISKIKKGDRDPSPELVAHLCTIAINPKARLKEIRAAWEGRLEKQAS